MLSVAGRQYHCCSVLYSPSSSGTESLGTAYNNLISTLLDVDPVMLHDPRYTKSLLDDCRIKAKEAFRLLFESADDKKAVVKDDAPVIDDTPEGHGRRHHRCSVSFSSSSSVTEHLDEAFKDLSNALHNNKDSTPSNPRHAKIMSILKMLDSHKVSCMSMSSVVFLLYIELNVFIALTPKE